VRAFCESGDVLAYPDPTFGMVPLFARMNAVRAVPVPLGPGFVLDADALLATRARLTYLCQPNNPTGHLFERAAIEVVAAGTGGVVLIDEAYADFANETDTAGEPVSFVQHAIDSERSVVLRTFSKAYGLAGLRVGYAIGPARLIREIEKSRGPYKVTAAADAAARAVLRDGAEWHRGVIDETRRNRTRLIDALRRLGYAPYPSAANFVLVPVDSAASFAAALRERGVAVRAFAELPGIGDAVRISIGPWALLERLLAALAEIQPSNAAGGR
jgi:histidinol-phosphate aminotransferase